MNDTAFEPPQKKRSILRWLVGIILLIFGFLLYQWFGPNPPIAVSPQTTYITEPLGSNGLPDYEQYLLDTARRGVTRENNAAVLLFQAMWPAELEPDQYDVVAAELGLDEIPSANDALQRLYGKENQSRISEWLQKRQQPSEESDVAEVIDFAISQPWTSQQLPPLAEWLDANQKPIDMLVEASRRTRFYPPSPTLLDDQPDLLIEVLLPGIQAIRDAARALSIRAMRGVGENNLDQSWRDTLAIYRLGELAGEGDTLVEQLVSVAIRGIACKATASILESDHLTEELVKQIRKDLITFTPIHRVAQCVDQLERISTLNAIVHSSIYGFDSLSRTGTQNDSGAPITSRTVDWNIILRHLNQRYDLLVAAMKLPPGIAREQAIAQFDADLQTDAIRLRQPMQMVSTLLSRKQRSEMIAIVFESLMMPAVSAACGAEDRVNATFTMIQLAAALAQFRVEHGAYPQKLEELKPSILNKVPVDERSNPFVYKPIDKGFLLYTIGDNGKDDGGSNELQQNLQGESLSDLEGPEFEKKQSQIPAGADDISIRLPRPLFVLPKDKTAGDAL